MSKQNDPVPSVAGRESIDRRIYCSRYPVGWGNSEIRVEGFPGDDADDRGVVVITAEGCRVEVPWHLLDDLADALRHVREALAEHRRDTAAGAAGAGVPNG
jgi:hypothetical protein